MNPTYSTTITKSNQITITKSARELLNVKSGDRLIIELGKDALVIRRRLTDEEFFEQLDALKSEKTKRRIKQLAGYNMDDFRKLPSYKEELKEKYAL